MRPVTVGWLLAAAAAAVLTVSACAPGHSRRAVRHYTIEHPTVSAGHLRRLPVVLRVAPFQSDAPFESRRMHYREAPHRMESYHYHRWRLAPAELLGSRVQRELSASGGFAAVVSGSSGVRETHLLEGRVDAFFEDDTRATCTAVAGLEITVVSLAGDDAVDAVLLQRSFAATERCDRRHPEAVAQAMSRAAAGMSAEVVAAVHAAVEASLSRTAPGPAESDRLPASRQQDGSSGGYPVNLSFFLGKGDGP